MKRLTVLFLLVARHARAGRRNRAGVCPSVSATAVVCPEPLRIELDLGDGDDSLVDRTEQLETANGGSGDDRLESDQGGRLNGDDGHDTLVGGRVSTLLSGGPGRDASYGGAGNDAFLVGDDGSEPVADLIDGGAGRDTVDYAGRSTPVRVELATDHEDATGGDGDDVLVGDDRPNRLDGGRGGDRVEGGGGDDSLTDHGGRRDVRGGTGDDRLELVGPSTVRCGAGFDRVYTDAGVTRLRPDCERVRGVGPVLNVRRRAVLVSWDQRLYPQGCRVRVTLDGTRIKRGRAAPVRRPATLRFKVERNCSTVFGDRLVDQTFRLTR